jgi:hypothetical protein
LERVGDVFLGDELGVAAEIEIGDRACHAFDAMQAAPREAAKFELVAKQRGARTVDHRESIQEIGAKRTVQ